MLENVKDLSSIKQVEVPQYAASGPTLQTTVTSPRKKARQVSFTYDKISDGKSIADADKCVQLVASNKRDTFRIFPKVGRSKQEKEWRVVTQRDWRENTVDKRTIYREENQNLLQTLDTDNGIMLPPLLCSPRMEEYSSDSQDILEKCLVMKHNLSTGQLNQYRKDSVILPTVYTDFLSCPERKKQYMHTMWTEYCRRNHKPRRPESSEYTCGGADCEYCDVMTSRYCAFCQEFKNRHFALTYEENYLPNICDRLSGGNLGGKLVRPPMQSLLPPHEKHAKKRQRFNRFIMPITYIPQDGQKP